MKTTALNYLLSLAAASSLWAAPQEPGDRPDLRAQLGPTSSIYAGFGLTRLQDRVLGAGPGYEAEFHPDGIRFTPALGSEVEETPLRLRLASVARRGAPARGLSTDVVAPVDDSDRITVRYPRHGYVETYELRADGVKQSFVFSSLPPGDGDLVVRLSVETSLPLAHAADDEIRYERAGIGGVRIGEVIGVDARGEQVRGTLLQRGDSLEMSLPASFVDGAALPLVLDPLLSGTVGVGATPQDDQLPDIAYDASNDVFLVVWVRDFGWSSFSILGQKLRPNGTMVGGPITIRPSSISHPNYGIRPRVANVNASNRFGVVWMELDNVTAASVPAGGGAVFTGYTVSVSQGHWGKNVCIAGDGGTSEDEAVVAWTDMDNRLVRLVQLELRTSAPPRAVGQLPAFSTRSVTSCIPALSKGSDASGRHVLAWNNTGDDIHAVVLDRDLNTLATATRLVVGPDLKELSVDGDGTHFVLAWAQGQSYDPNSYDIYAGALRFDEAAGQLTMPSGRIPVEADSNDAERRPAVAFMGDSALIAYEDKNGGNWDAYVKSVDPFGCRSCEGEFTLAGGSRNSRLLMIGKKHTGTTQGDRALIVWESQAVSGGDINLHARRFRTEDGIATQRYTGTGSGGTAHATCANNNNGDFALRLRGAAPNVPAYVLISPGLAFTRYCTGSTYLTTSTVIRAADTNSRGDSELPISINDPTLLGGVFYTQWWVMEPPQGCYFYFSHSNTLQVTVQ